MWFPKSGFVDYTPDLYFFGRKKIAGYVHYSCFNCQLNYLSCQISWDTAVAVVSFMSFGTCAFPDALTRRKFENIREVLFGNVNKSNPLNHSKMKSPLIGILAVLSVTLLIASCKKDKTTAPDAALRFTKTTTTGSQFAPLFDHQTVVFNNKLWVIGGRQSDVLYTNEIWSSTDGASWAQTTVSGPVFSVRSDHQVVVFNNKLWVIGGLSNGNALNDVWNSSDGAAWTQVNANAAFSIRSLHDVIVFNNKMWLIGGDGIGGTKNDIWSSADGITWTQETVTGTQFGPRAGHQVVVFNSKLFVIGGYSATGFKNDVWSSTDGRSWVEELTSGTKFVPLYSHQAIVYNNKLLVFGGLVGFVTTDEVWSSTNGKDWTKETNAAFGTRGGHQAVLFNNKICVTGGYDAAAVIKNDVWFSN